MAQYQCDKTRQGRTSSARDSELESCPHPAPLERQDFWCGYVASRKWIRPILTEFHRRWAKEATPGNYMVSFRRIVREPFLHLWNRALDRRNIDPWSHGFFFALDMVEADVHPDWPPSEALFLRFCLA